MTPPLAGIRVLDLSRVLAGPWCTQLLPDLGAEVIKIERPGVGDDTRHWGPPWHGEGDQRVAAYFLSANRGKKSAAIDFSKAEGAALVRKLAAQSDVVVENFKVGGLKKFGLDAESLRAANPRLIVASITGLSPTRKSPSGRASPLCPSAKVAPKPPAGALGRAASIRQSVGFSTFASKRRSLLPVSGALKIPQREGGLRPRVKPQRPLAVRVVTGEQRLVGGHVPRAVAGGVMDNSASRLGCGHFPFCGGCTANMWHAERPCD